MEDLHFENGIYRTPAGRSCLLGRLFPTWSFFVQYPVIVWLAARLAKRGRLDGAAWANSSRQVIRALERSGVEFEITGVEHLHGIDSAYVLAANHMSTLETMVLPAVLQPLRNTTFVVKQSLTTMPVFKHIMCSRHAIAVTQTNPREDLKTMLAEGVDRLKRGFALVVFPQGSRTPGFRAEEFNSIGVKLAARAATPLVPCAVATDAWGLGRWIPELSRIDPTRKVRIAFGEPTTVEGRGEEQHARTLEFIGGKLAAWGYGPAGPLP